MTENNPTATMDILEVLGKIAPLSAAYHERLKEQLETVQYPAKHLLLRPGDIARHLHFVSSGLVRIFQTDDLGREKTIMFMGPGELVVDVSSFFDQTPATEYLETLQETTLQSISWSKLNTFYADFAEGNYIGRIMTQQYLVLAVEKYTELLTYSTEHRYLNLLAKYPMIEQQVTQTHIASYLGISRETLSRLKSELLRKRL